MKEELEDLISKLTIDFGKTLPEDENEKTEIINAFKNHLYLAIKTIQESTSKFIGKDLDSIKLVLNNIANDFSQKDLNSIKQTLLVDTAFEEIRKKSSEIFEIAKKRMNGTNVNTEIDITTETEELQSLLNNVKGYNQRHAQELVSEAVVDLEYITNSSEDNLSLRLYQFKKRINSLEEER